MPKDDNQKFDNFIEDLGKLLSKYGGRYTSSYLGSSFTDSFDRNVEKRERRNKDIVSDKAFTNNFNKIYSQVSTTLTSSLDKSIEKLKEAQNKYIAALADLDDSGREKAKKELLEQSKNINNISKMAFEFEKTSASNIAERSKVILEEKKNVDNQRKLIEKDAASKIAYIKATEKDPAKRDSRIRDVNLFKQAALDSLNNVGTGEALGAALGESLEGVFDSKLGDIISSAVGEVPGLNAILMAVKAIEAITSVASKSMEQALSLQGQYMASIDTRLNGLNEQAATYTQIMNNMSGFAGSQYVSMKKLTENVAKLTESGIAYNLEERALLETIKDRMVTTFSAVEGQLDRLIKLQQTDLTKQQMGAEYELNRMLNTLFKDTSYLNNMYDSVSSALIDVTSSRGYGEAVEINFAAQKWLGSLASSGLSDSAVSALAQGLASLATGRIEDLNGTPLGNLFALSSREAGLSYTDILSNGLNASNINDFMKSMVSYLAQISQDMSNNVARTALLSQIGGNFTYSDIRAITNLASNTSLMNSIYNNNQDWGSTTNNFRESLSQVSSRTPTAYRVDTLLDNVLLNMGNEMINGSDNGMANYILYRVADLIPGVLGDVVKGAWSLLNLGNTFSGTKSTIRSLVNDLSDPTSNIETYLRNNFKMTNVSRGQAYIPTSIGNLSASTGISYSGAITPISNSSISEIDNYNLYRRANATTLSASNVTSTSSMIRDVGDIYAELFENQTKPIRVALAKVEEEAKEMGLKVALAKVEEGARNDLGIGFNGMLVDIQNNDINTLVNQVYTIRSSR